MCVFLLPEKYIYVHIHIIICSNFLYALSLLFKLFYVRVCLFWSMLATVSKDYSFLLLWQQLLVACYSNYYCFSCFCHCFCCCCCHSFICTNINVYLHFSITYPIQVPVCLCVCNMSVALALSITHIRTHIQTYTNVASWNCLLLQLSVQISWVSTYQEHQEVHDKKKTTNNKQKQHTHEK